MRILQVHTQYRLPGGEDVVVESEKLALTAAGHNVFQFLSENPADPVAAVAAMGKSVWNPQAARRLGRVIEDVRPDVAHVHNTWFASSPSVLYALRRAGIPVVMTLHNYRLICANSLFLRDGVPCEKCLAGTAWSAVRHGCYRDRVTSAVAATGIAVHRGLGTWSRLVDRFIVLSDFARERLIRFGLPERQLVLGANFVADPGPRPAPPSTSRDVMFVGRLSAEKGLSVLLDAWSRLQLPGLRLTIVGDGPDREACERAAPKSVTFLGHRPRAEVMKRLLEARALVVPSTWYEGQPVAVLEGLAAGTPLILSDIGGLTEILGQEQGGWRVAPGDADDVARALAELVDDERVDVRGIAARERYLKSFTAGAVVPRLEHAYDGARQSALQ